MLEKRHFHTHFMRYRIPLVKALPITGFHPGCAASIEGWGWVSRPRDHAVSDGARELRAAFKRIERELPPKLASGMRWLRHPGSRWVRLPAGIALIIGGIFSILPFLGLWMLPLGLMLVAADIAFLRRPMARLTMWGADHLDRYRARRRR
jgi:hypothetical protein